VTLRLGWSGMPDFPWYKIPKRGKNIPIDHKIYQIAVKYTNWPQSRPNGQKIYQHLPLQDPPKFTLSGIFGLKIYHLATLRLIAKYFFFLQTK
jgi:hypothetical protein